MATLSILRSPAQESEMLSHLALHGWEWRSVVTGSVRRTYWFLCNPEKQVVSWAWTSDPAFDVSAHTVLVWLLTGVAQFTVDPLDVPNDARQALLVETRVCTVSK